ncbi:MAG: lipoyl(octanoyl) transferase LipB [Chloroflexota bacterium]|nr:lipoyl(octanoyl) transferase LipB [Chloroflexota bacterium]
MNAPCEVWTLGCVPYADSWALQKSLAADAPDRLLLLSHPHTFTLGSSADENNLVWDADERARRGVELIRIDRGGDVTYHGAGQLVVYPILHLAHETGGLRVGVVEYLRRLEQVIIGTLADYRIDAHTIPGLTGVWVETARGAEKIAAIGVRVNVRAVTQHGFAVNLNTDLDYFGGIIPCGIRDRGVTSLARLTGTTIDESGFARRVVTHFGRVFERDMIDAAPTVALSRCH